MVVFIYLINWKSVQGERQLSLKGKMMDREMDGSYRYLKCLDADLSQVVGSSLHLDLIQLLRSNLQILRQHRSSDDNKTPPD